MRRTTRNAEKSKEEIIKKSAPIFNKYGYEGSKMNMIIDATGYRKGGIYWHFKSKKELAKAAFNYNYSLLKQNYEAEVFQHNSPKDQLIAFITGFKKFVADPAISGGCPILNLAIESDDTDEDNRLLEKKALDEWMEILESIIYQGIQKKDFKSDIDYRKEARFIIATIEGAIMMGKVKHSTRLILDIGDSIMDYIELKIFK